MAAAHPAMGDFMLPNFLHIGTAKCASSWLYRCCIDHPEIYVPVPPDNVNFFTVHYHRGMDWYRSTYFDRVAGEKAVGEFSNSYMCFEPAMQRIARHLPGVKLTMVLRNPVERAYLNWAHLNLKKRPDGRNKYGFDPGKGIGVPLEKALDHHGHAWFRHLLAPGLYAHWLDVLRRYFSDEQMLITLYDDLAADNAGYVRRFYGFLGVNPDHACSFVGKTTNPDVKQLDEPGTLTPELRTELGQVYREDIDRLQDMLDRDLSHWR
jgi:hypothetical protein